jgi:acetyl-CoA C-acetyltransferase
VCGNTSGVSVAPNTPVLVGVGQITERPSPSATYATRKQPLDLMVEALERAAIDAGATSTLADIDEIVAVSSFTWHTNDPALLVAERLGLKVATRRLSVGGNTPQTFVHDTARRILAGEVRCVALVGAEAMYARLLAKREGRDIDWVMQSDDVASPVAAVNDPAPLTAAEYGQGLNLPTNVYPLFENARRARLGWTLDEHRQQLGRLWSNFARVAAVNPYAWIQEAPTPEAITTPSADNRMVAFPYTKLLMANMPVDMAASFIMTSYEHASSIGVARDRMIFPDCGADANDHWLISDRPRLDDSPAMRAIWGALVDYGIDVEELAHLDLYSCFPTVVQTACDVLGIDAFDPGRVPTITGGLTFGGGPGNNYVTHAIASMVERLRAEPTSRGFVTALGWFCTKHSWGVYSATPPQEGFRRAVPQDAVDRLPRAISDQREGAATVESYTVTHASNGEPERLIVAARTRGDVRTWCHSTDPTLMDAAEVSELIGRTGTIHGDQFAL